MIQHFLGAGIAPLGLARPSVFLGQMDDLPFVGPQLQSTVNITIDYGSALQLQKLAEGRKLYPISFEIAFIDAASGAEAARPEPLSLERRMDARDTAPEIIDQQLDTIPAGRRIRLVPRVVGGGADALRGMGYEIAFDPAELAGTAGEFKGAAVLFNARLVEAGGEFPLLEVGLGVGALALFGIILALKGGAGA